MENLDAIEYQVFPRFDDDFNEIVRLIITKTNLNKRTRMIVKEIIWEEIDSSSFAFPSEPQPLRLHKEQAQSLMDRLWNIGFRPTEGTGSAGSLAATQSHLKTVSEYANWLMKMVEKQTTELTVLPYSSTIGGEYTGNNQK